METPQIKLLSANSEPSSDPKLSWVTVPNPIKYCIRPSPPVELVWLNPQLEVEFAVNNQPSKVTVLLGEHPVFEAKEVVVFV